MLIPKLNYSCDIIGHCVPVDDGCELASAEIIHSLEEMLAQVVLRAYVFCDTVSTLVVEVEDEECNEEFLENFIGFPIDLSHAEERYVLSLTYRL